MDFLLSLNEFWRNVIGIAALVLLVLLPLATIYGRARDLRNRDYND